MTAEPKPDWQRTSPTAALIFFGRAVRAIVVHGAPALVPLVAAFAAVDSLRWYWLPLALVPLAALLLLWSILSYLRFKFRLDDGLIVLQQGVLQHERLTIDFKRVQNVSIHEPFFMRPLGLAVLSIDTAGSQGKELTIAGIPRTLAETLRAEILADAAEARAGTDSGDIDGVQDDAGVASRLLIERTPRQIAHYGLTANGLFWVVIAIGFVTGLGGGQWLGTAMKALVEYLIGLVRTGGLLYLAGIVAVAVFLVLMIPMASVAGALIRHYGYRLTREGDVFRRASGLINRQEEALKQHKIQSVVWAQNGIARAMGVVTLKLEVAISGSPEAQAAGLPAGILSSFLVPALQPDEARRLIPEFLPDCDPESITFSTPDAWRCVGRPLLLFFTAPILIVTLTPALVLHWAFLLVLPLLFGIPWLFLRQVWSRWGYAVRGEYGFVRSGFLGVSVAMFPLFKMQRVDLRQTPGQRRAGLAHLTLHLASGAVSIPNVPEGDANRLRDLALYHSESGDPTMRGRIVL